MIILAGVTINAVINGGLLDSAQYAKNKWEQAQTNEQEALKNYEDIIDNISENNKEMLVKVSGSYIAVNDVSAVQHKPTIKLSSNTITDFSAINVTRTGKNILDVNDLVGNYAATNLNYDENTNSISFTKNREAGVPCDVETKMWLPVGTYTFSCDVVSADGFATSSPIVVRDTATLTKITPSPSSMMPFCTFTVTTAQEYQIMLMMNSASPLGNEITLTNIQLELGTEKTSFEPYTEQVVKSNSDGSVTGITSVSPNMTIFTDSDVIISCEYLKQITTKPETTADVMALPPQIYGFVNNPLKIYFLNLIDKNSLDGITIKVEDDDKGITYSDRWEYTPSVSENFDIKITMTDTTGNKIYKGQSTINIKNTSQNDSLSVLVIGDSTIAGGYETQTLLNCASKDNYNVTMIGTQGSESNHHEGRSGWSAGSFFSKDISPFYNPATSTFDFEYYMTQQGYTDLDCVCIQLGINDIFDGHSDEEVKIDWHISNMKKIINSIHSYNPEIKIIWNLILPGSTDQTKFDEAYGTRQTAARYKRNTYITNLEILNTVVSMTNVYIAHTNLSLDTTNNMDSGGNGGVHPAVTGYEEVGMTLYGVVRAIN